MRFLETCCDTLHNMSWPTTTDPRDNFVTVRFTDDEILALDTLRAQSGNSRSAAVRDAVWDAVVANKQKTRRKQGLSHKNDAGA